MALGWEEVDETELVRGQMVNVVHACIRRITATKGDSRKNAIATGGQVNTCSCSKKISMLVGNCS